MIFRYLSLSLSVFLFFGFTPLNVNTTSLEWQKLELEKNIINKVTSSLAPVIRSGEYIVNVEVVVKSEKKLSASAGGSSGKGSSKSKPKIRFNDMDPSEAKGDFIVLSKLGLEAPLYNEEDQKDAGLAGEQKSEAADWQKFLIQYLENQNLSKAIESINIDVKLDNYLGDETRKTVEGILKGLKLQHGGVKASLKISYIDMKEMKKEFDKRKESEKKEFYEWIGKIGIPIGIICAALVLGAFAWFIFKKYAELFEKQMEMMKAQVAAQAPVQEKKTEENETGDKSLKIAGALSTNSSEMDDGIERFRAMLKNNFLESCIMIKRWIRENNKTHQLVLNALVKELSSEELTQIFEQIGLEDRKAWKKYIGKNLRPEELTTARRYIGAQVVQEMIIPNTITDPKIVELLIRIKPEESAAFAQQEPHLAAILMNVMNAKFLSKMMDRLSDEQIQKLLKSSFELGHDRIGHLLEEFRIKLSNYVHAEISSPFMEKLVELIPLSSPMKERALYQGMAQTGNHKTMLELARNYFPTELVFKVPEKVLKTFVQSFPREKRPELVLIVDDHFRSKFIDIIASNQKAKDMLALDLEKFESNPTLKTKVLENKEILLKEFVDHCRSQIKLQPLVIKELEPVLETWVASFDSKSGSDLNKAAA